MGLAPWQVDRARKELSKWDANRLAAAIEAVAQADADVKGASRAPAFALERVVRTVAELGELSHDVGELRRSDRAAVNKDRRLKRVTLKQVKPQGDALRQGRARLDTLRDQARAALARHLHQNGSAGVQVAIVDLDEIGVLKQLDLRPGANEVVKRDPESLGVQVREPCAQRVIRERRLHHFDHDSRGVAVEFLVRHKIGAREVDGHGVAWGDVRSVEERGSDHVLRGAVLLALVPQVDAETEPAGSAE